MTHHTRVGVLRGGPSSEYDVSLQSGANVLNALRTHHPDRYRVYDIFIDKDGVWHMDGISMTPERVLSRVDVVFNSLHGTFGEDGKVQHILESCHKPFTGSGSLASAMGMNKILAKKMFVSHGIRTPKGKEVASEHVLERNGRGATEITGELFETCLLPVVVKPAASGSSVGVTIVRSYGEFPGALIEAARHGDAVLIEEYIRGDEATCGVIEGFRGHDLYALPPVEIKPMSGFFDYEAKYGGKSREIVPANFKEAVKRELEELAKSVHRVMGLKHYSRTDFIVHPRRGVFALEVNTLPGLTNESLLPKAIHAVGAGFHDFIAHILELAHRGK